MKKTFITLALAALAAVPAMAQKQMPRLNPGIGPVEAASMTFRSLPENAQTFINTLFPSTAVSSVVNDFKDHEYDVTMSDGYEITFDYAGNWTQVEAPDGVMLPSSTLVALVPEQTVITTLSGDDLVNGGVMDSIEEIEVYPEGYLVEYAAGTYGKGKAAVSKTDGKITGHKLSARQSKCGKKDGHRKARHDRGGKARTVKFNPAAAVLQR
ncbi:MAG: hypothetical protein J6L73_01420 [Muribaculaceae bacterium]|nr:hypothetical protein [Muribaculaceae bacterium]